MPIDNMLNSTFMSNNKVKLSTVSSIGILLFVLSVSLFLSCAFIAKAEAHKLLEIPYDNNTEFESALTIPNHTVSWAIYQGLGGQDNATARFYKFDNKEINSSFYAHISIPKVEKYLKFTPSLSLIGPVLENDGNKDTPNIFDNAVDVNQAKSSSINNNLPFGMPQGYQTLIQSDYNGAIPSPVSYEPFTQTSYWERQEIRTLLPGLGVYYVVVYVGVFLAISTKMTAAAALMKENLAGLWEKRRTFPYRII